MSESQSKHPDTPNIPSSAAVLRIQSSTVIDAPIDRVWDALTDTSTYPSWNRFVPRITIREQPSPSNEGNENDGNEVLKLETRFTFHVNMYPETSPTPQPDNKTLRDTLLTITECNPPPSTTTTTTELRTARIVWAGDRPAQGLIMSSLLTAERVHELCEIDVEGEDGVVKRMTEVRNWESQIGSLAYVVRWMFGGRLRGNFGVWEAGLKGFVEGVNT